MKLSIWTICDYLIKKGYDVETYISEGHPCISLVRQSSTRTYSAGYAEVFSAGKDVNVVNDMDRLVVKNVSVVDVLNTVAEAVDFYSRWEHEIYDCIFDKGTLQQLLDIAKIIFERPMFIKNDSTRTLAITHGYSSNVHPFWDKIDNPDQQKLSDFEIVSIVSSDPDYKTVFADKYPSIKSSPAYGGMVLHANVFIKNRRAAEVVVLENGKPFNKGDIHLMNTFVELLTKYAENDSHLFQTASDITLSLSKLIENNQISKEQYTNIRKYLGLESADNMCLVVVSGEDKLDSPILSALRERLENQLKNSVVLQQNNKIIILRLMKGASYKDMIEDFKNRIPKKGFLWGISYEFIHLEEIPDFYRQACDALNKGSFDSKNYVSAYEVVTKVISEICMKDGRAKSYVHPDLYRLEHVDVRDNTEYLETLYYFLLCGGNFTDASKIMNLHRNTLIYRLNKIREIVHSNLDDISNRELLLYSYLLLDKEYRPKNKFGGDK